MSKVNSNCNGGANQVDVHTMSRCNNNASTDNYKKKYATENNKPMDTVAIDYPELGLTDYKMSSNSNFLTNSSGLENMASQSSSLASGGFNGLSPLNKSQIISRRLKLDLRNETEVPIAGNDRSKCFNFLTYFWRIFLAPKK